MMKYMCNYQVIYLCFIDIVYFLIVEYVFKLGFFFLVLEIGYMIQEVRVFEMVFQYYSGSLCKDVLSDWGLKNVIVKDLYLILQRIGRRREM